MSTARLRWILLGGGVLAGLVLLVATLFPEGARRARESAARKIAGKALEAASGLAKNIHLGDPAQGWELKLGECSYSETGQTASCSDVRIVYRMEATRELVITADQAKATTDDWEIDLEGHVTMTSRDLVVRTDRVHYSSGEHRITSDEPLELTARGLHMTGTGLEVEVEKQIVAVRSDVHTRIDVAEGTNEANPPALPEGPA